MAEYLSKEEIKQWRSSLEKITLEEFAARLGKKVADSRPTNDLVDIVFNEEHNPESNKKKIETTDKLSRIAERAFARERQLSHTPFSFRAPIEHAEPVKNEEVKPIAPKKIEKPAKVEKVAKTVKPIKETKVAKKAEPKAVKESKPIIAAPEEKDTLREEVNIVLKKNLTDREQVVFDYLLEHKNETVYAKDLAVLLDLPRDYIYKYIKNLRAKIEGDKLKNATRGGFVLSV